jgi:hypothetical protein
MKDELRKLIEQFIVDYENQINDIDNMDMATTDVLLETAISLLTETVQESGVQYEP